MVTIQARPQYIRARDRAWCSVIMWGGNQGLTANGWLVFLRAIGPLQLVIHVVQNRRAGEQKSPWDETNKENYHLKLCTSFVCLVPVRLLLSSLAVQLYHVNGYVAEIWSNIMKTIWLRRKLITILQLYGNLKVIFDSNLFNRQLSNY